MLRRLSVTLTVFIIWQFCSSLTLAETKKPQQPDKFPPNPLEITTPDPLLPRTSKKEPLTQQEMQDLEVALDKLNQEAAAKLQAGDKQAAFDTWNRELRLRRYLGSLAEVQALSRVGAIAWSENDRPQVQYITQRLQKIHTSTQSQKTGNLELWQSLGQAYTNVRSPKEALEAYERVLAEVRQQQDTAAEVETLKAIANLHMSWFDYPKAAATYEQLLSFASTKGDRLNEITYLQQLAYIYEQTKQPQQSVKVRNQLVALYQQSNDLTQLPVLKLAIGSDYESLAKENPGLLKEAFNNYQEAYATAWQLQQYTRAGEALRKLIALYRSQGQIEEALQASQILLQTEERAVNYYGLMSTYDQIGQIHLERKQYPQALAAFQKGLELAQQLKHEEAYFTEQIEKASKQSSN
ncbi:MAG: tetratricopeptide repeat protein [Heteroscytonema crispum UTEX LB 1556]